jgi:FemAB-related protein (PEP-CTERM system-associated)
MQVVAAQDPQPWHAFVGERIHCPLAFRWEWDLPLSVYGLKVLRFIAMRDDRPVGLLPLVWQRSMLFGKHLVSLPWFDAAGVIADDDAARDALVDAAVAEAQSRGGHTVQLRHMSPQACWPHVRTDKVLMQLELTEDPETLWKSFSPKVRNQVRKAEKSGLTVQRETGPEALDAFYRVYATNMRDLGSPAHGRRFFDHVLQAFPEIARLHLVRHEDRVIGGGFTMVNGSALEIPWASSLREYNRYCVNHAMYWHLLEGACREGLRQFRFGRSTIDAGTYHFKKQWGAAPHPLYWYYVGRDEVAAQAARPPEESYGRATQIWRRLPLWLTNVAGPRIIAKVP